MKKREFWNFSVEEPEFPERSVSVLDLGAIKGGMITNTEIFNKAIRMIHEEGGGHVVVPSGIFLTGPLTLLSNVDLHLERGAVILFTHSEKDYPLIRTDFEGEERIRALAPIHAQDQENIAITGDGIINGNGHQWRLVKRSKTTDAQWEDLLKRSPLVSGVGGKQVWFPSQSSFDGHMNPEINAKDADALEKAQKYFDYYRPEMIKLVSCKRVLIEGVTLQNSPAWNIHPLFCEHFTLRNVMVRNPWNAQNGDGLDLDSCKYVNITKSRFDVGDDAICMKSGKNAEARKVKRPTECVNIESCIVYHGHGGFTVGSEMSRGVRNVRVRNCDFIGTDVGIRFKSTLGRGGVVEDIHIDDINMLDIPKHAILFTMAYAGAIDPENASKEDFPEFKNITISNVNALNCGQAIGIDGINNDSIHDILLNNINISAYKGAKVEAARDIYMQNVAVSNSNDHYKTKVINETVGDGYEYLME